MSASVDRMAELDAIIARDDRAPKVHWRKRLRSEIKRYATQVKFSAEELEQHKIQLRSLIAEAEAVVHGEILTRQCWQCGSWRICRHREAGLVDWWREQDYY